MTRKTRGQAPYSQAAGEWATDAAERLGVSVSTAHRLLAMLVYRDFAELYADAPEVDLSRLRQELSLVRKRGFALNDQATETGLSALGMLVDDRSGPPTAAISLAMPTARFDRHRLAGWVETMTEAVSGIAHDLAREV